MPRTCTICTHPEREAVDRALVDSVSLRTIADQYKISKSALIRHREGHLPLVLALAKGAEEIAHAESIMAELRRIMARVNLVYDACDRWLRDPEDPTRYEIGPRAEDVKVTYTTQEISANGRFYTARHKARLSTLLEEVNGAHGNTPTFVLVETKHADPRDLVLKAAETLKGQLELMTKLITSIEFEERIEALEKAVKNDNHR